MFNDLCDNELDSHAMKIINRAFLTIAVCFLGFAGNAITTRLGASVPPTSVTYGTEAPHATAAVFGD